MCVYIYIYIRFKVERCYFFQYHMLVSFQGKSHGVFGVAIMVSSENVLYSFLVRKGVNRKKLVRSPLAVQTHIWSESMTGGCWK